MQDNQRDVETEAYEPPVIEDVDTSLGTVATTPGILPLPSDLLP